MDNDKFQQLVLQQLQAITSEIKDIKDNQQQLESRADQQYQGISGEIKSLQGNQQQLGLKLDKLEMRMENEVINKLRVLFDADKLREEKLNLVMARLEGIEIDVGYLVARVVRLEKAAR